MTLESSISSTLVKRDAGSRLESIFSGLSVDLLFVSAASRYREDLVGYLKFCSINVQNVAEVSYDLYPAGGGEGQLNLTDYDRERGIHHVFGIGTFDNGLYSFSGDELNPEHALIIVNKSITHGRAFRQVCEVLEHFLGRDIRSPSAPPTFAFFCRVRPNLNGLVKLDAENVFVPVGGNEYGYLPFWTEYF